MKMGLKWFLAVLTVSGGLAEELCSRQPLAGFYEEIGCVPRKENDSACPSSYDCSEHEKRHQNKCHFRGKAYAIGQDLEDLPENSCAAACKCLAYGDKPSFNCAHVECPELFGVKPDPGCRFSYVKNKCCGEKTCGPSPATCSYQNETYLVGQKFYPTDQPCKTCICMENFQGKLEQPFCSDVQCNTQLFSLSRINDGCVPIYYGEDGCCPIQWKCPEDADSIRKAKSPKVDTKMAPVCKFGSLVLQPGDELQHSEETVDCACKLPPYLTCIMKRRS